MKGRRGRRRAGLFPSLSFSLGVSPSSLPSLPFPPAGVLLLDTACLRRAIVCPASPYHPCFRDRSFRRFLFFSLMSSLCPRGASFLPGRTKSHNTVEFMKRPVPLALLLCDACRSRALRTSCSTSRARLSRRPSRTHRTGVSLSPSNAKVLHVHVTFGRSRTTAFPPTS